MLRSAVQSLEFQITAKDELIEKLKGDSSAEIDSLKKTASSTMDEQVMRMKATNTKLEAQLADLTNRNFDLEEKVIELNKNLKNA